MDSGNECMEEVFRMMLPDQWRTQVVAATYDNASAVIAMVRDVLPYLLVIHSNFLNMDPKGLMANCAAASPGTRYLLMTAWSDKIIDETWEALAPLNISMEILRMPFERAEFIATLKRSCEWLT
jgi:hypothetical protein